MLLATGYINIHLNLKNEFGRNNFKVGIIEDRISAVGGMKRPTNTFEIFDLEVLSYNIG